MRGALGWKKLIDTVQLSEYTINQLEKNGLFPKRFALTDKRVAWNRDEVEEWLDGRQLNPPPQPLVTNNPDVRKRKTRPVKNRQEHLGATK